MCSSDNHHFPLSLALTLDFYLQLGGVSGTEDTAHRLTALEAALQQLGSTLESGLGDLTTEVSRAKEGLEKVLDVLA